MGNKLEIEAGDLFGSDINDAIESGLKVRNSNWGLWGYWLYGGAKEDQQLVGLLSKGYGNKAMGGYASLPGHEEIVDTIRTKLLEVKLGEKI